MARRLIGIAAMLLLVSGCGDSTPENLTERGLKELRTGQYDQAIATNSKAINENPRNPEPYLYRGRAYQFRNAMGDPKRAIADFSEAIRLAPDSPDAYYSRAIVYRDLGQTELANADDKKARASDDLLHEVYRKLPVPPKPKTVADASPKVPKKKPPSEAREASGDALPESPFERRRLYEQLKEDFEPGRNTADRKESPIERYNRLSRQPLEAPADEPSSPLGAFRPQPSLAGQPEPSLSEDANRVIPRPGRRAPSSPFGSPLPSGPTGQFNLPPQSPPTFRPLQSPFGTRTPAPTGRVQPANPFGQPSSCAVRPQPPSSAGRYSNPAVRPPNPRDYVP